MAPIYFTHNGQRYRAEQSTVDTDYGPELAVDIFNSDGERVFRSCECANVRTQIKWFCDELDQTEQLEKEYNNESVS
jgi:hypothetical protein